MSERQQFTAIFWEAYTVVLPEPVRLFPQGGGDVVNSSVSFRVEVNTSISTLSDRGAFSPDGFIQGLYYVPDLNALDPCANLSSQYLPQNVTRKANIPGLDQYALVGVAPWVSDHPECAVSYMQASQADRSQGLFFFPTRQDASTATPVWENPDWGVNALTWGDWVKQTDHPIWGIPSAIGTTLVQEMGKYSSNVSVAPFASELSNEYPPEDAVRLHSRVALKSSRDSNPILGRLWVFAIMILAILCVVTALTSIIMHINQRRLRRDLRRRIANGEVDLEVLGIKRQRVPQKLLDKMPLYVYTSKDADDTLTTSPVEKPNRTQNLPHRTVPFSQPTCPICLDDFTPSETLIRELPCRHIFHPECIDSFLLSTSSLCPTCKTSALPTGYCPENITISMVRRERAVRRMREFGTDSPPLSYLLPNRIQRFLPAWLLRMRPRPRQGAEQPYRQPQVATVGEGRPDPSLPLTPSRRSVDVEMGALPNPQPQGAAIPAEQPPPEIQALSPEQRREWGRARLAATLPTAAADEAEPRTKMDRVRRAVRGLFPT